MAEEEKKEKEFKPYLMFDYVDAAGVPDRAYKEVGFKELSKGSTESDDIIILGGGISNGLLPIATETDRGIVELATSGENASDVVVQGNDSRINVVTTKGDIYGCSGTNTPARVAVGSDAKFLKADSSASTGLSYKFIGGLAGDWIYGDGFDGALTLSGNVTMATDEQVVSYTNLTLAGFTLSMLQANRYAMICVSGTLSGGGGSISSIGTSATSGGAGGTTSGQSGTSGDGGDGAKGGGSLYVFARIATSVTITAAGAVSAGVAGGTWAADGDGAAGSDVNVASFNIRGLAINLTTAAGGGANAGGAGGAGGDHSAANRLRIKKLYSDITRCMASITGIDVNSVSDGRHSSPSNGGGGGAGGSDRTPFAVVRDGGSGGGGAKGMVGAGGAGAVGGTDAGSLTDVCCGGGGGGGGGGGEVIFFSNDATSVTVTANGGAGGAGGAGSSVSDTTGAGGGGGGGGGGGFAMAVAPSITGITCTAAGGAGGAGGAGTGSGTTGDSGSPGSDGRSFPIGN